MARADAKTVLGQNVMQLCRAHGWDSAVLASKLGWSPEQTLALEVGTLDATLDQIDALAAVFEVPPFELMQQPEAVNTLTWPQLRYG